MTVPAYDSFMVLRTRALTETGRLPRFGNIGMTPLGLMVYPQIFSTLSACLPDHDPAIATRVQVRRGTLFTMSSARVERIIADDKRLRERDGDARSREDAAGLRAWITQSGATTITVFGNDGARCGTIIVDLGAIEVMAEPEHLAEAPGFRV